MSKSFIQQSIEDGSLKLWHSYRAGTFVDLSGNGNDGAPADVNFTGNGLEFPKLTSNVVVLDDASIRLTEGSLVCFGPIATFDGLLRRLFSKRDAGGTEYSWRALDIQYQLYDGVSVRTRSSNNINTSMYRATNFVSGGTAEGFEDGKSIGLYSGVNNFSTGTSPLYLGNIYNNTAPIKGGVGDFLIFDEQLTEAEHAQLYGELSNLSWPKSPSITSFADIRVDPNESGLVAGYDMFPVDGEVVDASGSGNDGDIDGPIFENTLIGSSMCFDGQDDVIDCGTDFIGTGDITASCWIKPFSIGEVAGRIVENGSFIFGLLSTNSIFVSSNGSTTVASDNEILFNGWNHVVVTRASDGTSNLYVNGVISGLPDRNSGTPLSATTNVIVGNNSTRTRSFDGCMSSLKVESEVKSQAWVTEQYERGKTALWKTGYGVTESVSAVTGGPLENSPFYVESGSFKISSDTIDGDVTSRNLVVDGDMEKAGIADWTSSNTISKNTDSPYEGLQSLKAEGAGNASQAILTVGDRFRLKGAASGDGISSYPYITVGGSAVWVGTTSTDWQTFNAIIQPSNVNLRLWTAGSGFTKWDAIEVNPYYEDVKVIECISDGICYVPTSYFGQSIIESAYGIWNIWFNKADASSTRLSFVSDTGGTSGSAGNGYNFWVNSLGSVFIRRFTSSVEVSLMTTNTGYFDEDVWNCVTLERKSGGVLYTYLNSELVIPSSGTNPLTDNSHVSSSYMRFDMDAGDKIAYSDLTGKYTIQKTLL